MFNNWEEFALGPENRREEIHVTLNEKGEIMIGATAAERFKNFDWAVLLYDRWNGLIGIVPVKERTPNAFRLFEKSNGRHRVIRANRFCRYYGIFIPQTTACKAEFDEKGILSLDLRATRAVRK